MRDIDNLLDSMVNLVPSPKMSLFTPDLVTQYNKSCQILHNPSNLMILSLIITNNHENRLILSILLMGIQFYIEHNAGNLFSFNILKYKELSQMWTLQHYKAVMSPLCKCQWFSMKLQFSCSIMWKKQHFGLYAYVHPNQVSL